MKVNIGKGIELDVDVPKFNAGVMDHLVYIGLRNVLMDSHAGVTAEIAGDQVQTQSRAVAERKLAAMYAGEIRTARTGERDPVRAEAIRLAINAIHAQIKSKGKKVAAFDAKAIREKAITNIEKFMDKARANVADAKALDIDVGDLPVAAE
jgi:hypothetical protein